jgi:hypothetical protein
MQRRNKTSKTGGRNVTSNKAKSKARKSKNTPFADVGQILGGAVGSMFNLDLSGAGRWLGSGIGSIFGSGDYTVAGPNPSQNVLFNSAQIPKFASSKATNVVCHREYLGDITGSTTMNNVAYRINPADPHSFPWLSTVAQSYTQYKIHGMIYEFKSLTTDFVTAGKPGYVAMATNYNAREAKYTSKMELENSEFSASCKPTMNLIHGIECAPDQTSMPIKYLSSGSQVYNPQDYDMGNFQIMVGSQPDSSVIGELWVSYCVEFFKPAIPETPGGDVHSAVVARSTGSGAAPLGTIQLYSIGNIREVTVNSTALSFLPLKKTYYLVSVFWVGGATVITHPTITPSNCDGIAYFQPTVTGPGSAFFFSPSAGATTSQSSAHYMLRSREDNNYAVLTFSTAGVAEPGTTILVTITKIDDNAISPA